MDRPDRTARSGAWLLVGPKGAGKTSSALSLTQPGWAALLDNDRTAVVPTPGNRPQALPVPLSVRVAPGTLKGLGAWEEVCETRAGLFSRSSAVRPLRAMPK
jgi:hypothetical protein